jgi:hypothetical protein
MTTDQDESRVEDGGNRAGGYIKHLSPRETAHYLGLPESFIPERILRDEVRKSREWLHKQKSFPTGRKVAGWESSAGTMAGILNLFKKGKAEINANSYWMENTWRENLKDVAKLIAVGYSIDQVEKVIFEIDRKLLEELLSETEDKFREQCASNCESYQRRLAKQLGIL